MKQAGLYTGSPLLFAILVLHDRARPTRFKQSFSANSGWTATQVTMLWPSVNQKPGFGDWGMMKPQEQVHPEAKAHVDLLRRAECATIIKASPSEVMVIS